MALRNTDVCNMQVLSICNVTWLVSRLVLFRFFVDYKLDIYIYIRSQGDHNRRL